MQIGTSSLETLFGAAGRWVSWHLSEEGVVGQRQKWHPYPPAQGFLPIGT